MRNRRVQGNLPVKGRAIILLALLILTVTFGSGIALDKQSSISNKNGKAQKVVNKVSNAIDIAADKTGKALEKAANKTGQALEKAGKKIRGWFED